MSARNDVALDVSPRDGLLILIMLILFINQMYYVHIVVSTIEKFRSVMLSIFVVSEPPVLLVVGQHPSSQSSKQCLSCIVLNVKTTLSGRFLWEVWQWSLPSLVPIACGILLALSAGWLGFDFVAG